MQQMDVVRNQTSVHRAHSLPGELPVVSYVIIYVHATDTGHRIMQSFFLVLLAQCLSVSVWNYREISRLPVRRAGNTLAFTQHDESSPQHDRQADKHDRETGGLADRSWKMPD